MTKTFFSEGTTSLNGLIFHYRDWGGSGRPVVLLHGLASHSGIWGLVGPILAQDTRVLALDLRGHGDSCKPDYGYDFDTISADVRTFWQRFDISMPILIGHSWGGNVALHIGIAYPKQVAAVVMVDGGFIEPSAVDGWTWERAKEELSPPSFEGLTQQDLIAKMREGDLGPYWTLAIERIALLNFRVNSRGLIDPKLSRANHMQIVRSLWEHKPSILYQRLQCPALILAARGHPPRTSLGIAKSAMVTRAQALLAQGKVVWMEDTIHDIPLQRPRKLANTILDWIRHLPNPESKKP